MLQRLFKLSQPLGFKAFQTPQSLLSRAYSSTQLISLQKSQNNYNNNNNTNGQSHQSYSHVFLACGLIIPIVLFNEYSRQKRSAQCLWGRSDLQRNKISGRIATSEYNANDPIEDRHHCKQLKNIDAYVCAVFDGHGGWALSEYAKNLFINELDFQFELLAKKKFESEDALIIEALNKAFDYIEQSFYEVAVAGKIQRPFNVGSCALIALVKDNKVYTANAGDCKGVLLSENDSKTKTLTARKINHKQNANSKKEQARLKKEFPNDSDIVICKRGGEGACYVKGRLMPTRSLGDFHLKKAELFKGKGKYTGPYITHKPEIIIHEIQQNDKYLVMASDGLWDEMKKDKIAQIASENKADKTKVVQELFNSALLHAATEAKKTVNEMAEIPAGERRRFHDDITIVCVDLENQFKKGK